MKLENVTLYIIKKFKFTLNVFLSRFFNFFSRAGFKEDNFLNSRETLNFLSSNKKSIIRWGDGESFILLGGDIYFQKYDNKLHSYLIKIVKDYYKSDCPYLLAIPNIYLRKSLKELNAIGKGGVWKNTRYVYKRFFCKSKIYGEALLFRMNYSLSNKEISKLWDEAENIIFIHPDEKVFKDFKTRYSNCNIFFIKIPSKNAFSEYENILNEVKNKIFNNNLNTNNLRILLSAGPTARTLVYDLSKMGFICYDLGNYFLNKFYNKLDKNYK